MLPQALLLIPAMAGGSLIQGVCGFGLGIVATMVLSLVLPVNQAAAVSSLVCLGLTLPMVLRYRRHLRFRKVLIPLLVYSLAATLIIRVSAGWDSALLKRLFGAFLLGLSLYYFLLSRRVGGKWGPLPSFAAFAFSGACSGLFAVGGPLMALYFLSDADSKEEFLGNTQLLFVLSTVPSFFARVSSGLLMLSHLRYILPSLVGVAVGFLLAGTLVHRIDKARLTRLVYAVVGLSGLLYLLGM